ncbi:MAG: redoxin family protein [Acidobacteria bacterium]|nr:redoxin family protein [Acidobacteriota bacterium]
MRSLFLLVLILVVTAIMYRPVMAQQAQEQAKPAEVKEGKVEQAPPVDSDEELRKAIESSGGNEAQIVINLEGYLKKFPDSKRRIEIETEIYKLSIKLRDRDRAISYAEKIVAIDNDNIDALSNLVTVLRERRADGDLNKALGYADLLVSKVETILSSSLKPKRMSSAQWADRKERGLASVYLLRGKVQSDLGNMDKARSDLSKSFKATPLAGAALSLGELAEKSRKLDDAIDHYLQAFVIALSTDEQVDPKSIRAKLKQLYIARFGSENGLGDRMLREYDEFTKEREERASKLEQPNINSGVASHLDFKLTRLDGSKLEMNSLRGKVVVMNFWATWCGPCLTEMPLFEKTIEKYKEDPGIVFLAVTTDEDREIVKPFLKQHKFNLPVTFADYLNDYFEVNSIPTTIILDRSGQVSFRQAGFNPREDFVAMLSGKIEAARKR